MSVHFSYIYKNLSTTYFLRVIFRDILIRCFDEDKEFLQILDVDLIWTGKGGKFGYAGSLPVLIQINVYTLVSS